MTDHAPGAISNVRRGQYEDASGMLHTGWLHDHVCLFPGCGGIVPCEAQPVVDDAYDGIRGRYACELNDIDPLCDMHADAVPCGYCEEYGHDEAQCPEAVSTEDGCEHWTGADWQDHAADAALHDERDGR